MRLAYILPRYGPEIAGGAETLARHVIEQMIQRGHQIEVWTTGVHDIYTWENEYPLGVEQINGVTVRRFPVKPCYPYDLLANFLTLESQYEWVNALAHSQALYQHIADCGDAFDFLIFMPYLVGMSYSGSKIHPHKSIVWTCLHDELFAYLTPTRTMLTQAVGLIFNSFPERDLVEGKLQVKHPRTVVAGMGFETPAGDAAVFRRQYPSVKKKFFVYAGRLDPNKNVHLLVDYFRRYRSRRGDDLELLLLGAGPLENDVNYPGVISLGFVDEATKRNIFAAATFLCQPSLQESFSIVLLESWAQKRPVLVHEECPVTVDHVRQAQGGLYFTAYEDFEGAIDYFLENPDQAGRMGQNGHRYVQQNYNWSAIIDRLEDALSRWLEQTA